MRKNWSLLSIALLAAVLTIGAVACGGGGDANEDTPTATAEQTDDAAGAADSDADDDMDEDADGEMDDDADDDMIAADDDMDDDAGDMDDDMADGVATVIVTDGILTDSAGNTLYIWDNDAPGVSNCADGCAGLWPPLSIDGEAAAGESVEGVLATITRDDGGTQVTHNDQPLYYYSADAAPGDRNGDGVGATWHIVAAGG